jgi:hypothetical protein
MTNLNMLTFFRHADRFEPELRWSRFVDSAVPGLDRRRGGQTILEKKIDGLHRENGRAFA